MSRTTSGAAGSGGRGYETPGRNTKADGQVSDSVGLEKEMSRTTTGAAGSGAAGSGDLAWQGV